MDSDNFLIRVLNGVADESGGSKQDCHVGGSDTDRTITEVKETTEQTLKFLIDIAHMPGVGR